jgi:hypothetical protein
MDERHNFVANEHYVAPGSVLRASRSPRASSQDETPCPSRSAADSSRSFCSLVQRRRIESSLRNAFGFRRTFVSAMRPM